MLASAPRRSDAMRAVLTGIAVLTLASVVIQILRLRFGHDTLLGLAPLLDVRREQNVPTWYSSVLLLACGVVLADLGLRIRTASPERARRWLVLATLFCLASLDESASIHESLGGLGRRFEDRPDFLVRPWVVFAVPVVAAVLWAYVPFFRRRPPAVRRAFLVGAALFVGGALGVEVIEILLSDGPRDTPALAWATSAQELFEMLGIAASPGPLGAVPERVLTPASSRAYISRSQIPRERRPGSSDRGPALEIRRGRPLTTPALA
jgi:hypothetical protein